mgnify:CR=1 FL=1
MALRKEEWKAKLHTMKHYDSIARHYDELYGREQLAKMESIDQEVHIKAEDLILDVGCGTGLLFDFVAPKAGLLVGLDMSSEQLKIAYKKMKTFPNVQLVRADAEYMPFRENVFDKVIAVTLLQNLSDPEKFLGEVVRVNKPHGECVITALKKRFDKNRLTSLFEKAGLNFRFLKEKTKDFIILYRIA